MLRRPSVQVDVCVEIVRGFASPGAHFNSSFHLAGGSVGGVTGSDKEIKLVYFDIERGNSW